MTPMRKNVSGKKQIHDQNNGDSNGNYTMVHLALPQQIKKGKIFEGKKGQISHYLIASKLYFGQKT